MSDTALAQRKMHVPERQRGLVARPDLASKLHLADLDVAMVVAPAGYGKTTLATELLEADDRPAVWLSLDAGDNDPIVLLGALVAALSTVEPIDPAILAATAGGLATTTTVIVPRLTALVARWSTPVVVVLDDVHELVDVDALDLLSVLLTGLGGGSTVVVLSRSTPDVRLGRLRVHRRVAEVGMSELALSVDSAHQMFRSLNIPIGRAHTAQLVETTEGWPAILYVAALWLGRQDDISRAVDEFAGDHRLVVDYLRDELLDGLSDELRTFLFGASCLERLSGPLCDSVLTRRGSGELLEQLEATNLLVIALDERQEWFRLHHMMGDMLRAELQRRNPELAAVVHRRASAWFEDHDDPDAAIRHAWQSGDVARAETLIAQHFSAFATTGRHATIQRWLDLFTESQLSDNPMLAVVAGYARLAAGDEAGVAHWNARAQRGLAEPRPDDVGIVPAVAVALQHATIARITAEEMAAEACYGRDHAAHGPWHAMACLLVGAAEFMLGDIEQAADVLAEGAAESAISKATNVESLCLAHLAIVAIEADDWPKATLLARRGRSLLRDGGLERMPNLFLVTAVSSLVEAHAGRPDEADRDRSLTRRNLTYFPRSVVWANLQARVALARTNIALGDRVAARTRLGECAPFLAVVPDATNVAAQLAELRAAVAPADRIEGYGPSALTIAELRVLHYLPTHLTLAEIADRLYVSRNTVKSQTIAIYRKFGATSRGAAVDVARRAGLFDDAAPVA